MVSLLQADAVRKLEDVGWAIVEPTNKHAIGGPVMMKRVIDGNVSHILVMPNGEHSAPPPTAAQIRDW
jgi:hypothetical protein